VGETIGSWIGCRRTGGCYRMLSQRGEKRQELCRGRAANANRRERLLSAVRVNWRAGPARCGSKGSANDPYIERIYRPWERDGTLQMLTWRLVLASYPSGSDKERQSCVNGSDKERSRSPRDCDRSLSLPPARSKNRSPPTKGILGVPTGIACPKIRR
jgi:hypothetical protein